MVSTPSRYIDGEANSPASDIRRSLRRLDSESSWQWWSAILVITLLMGTIVVLSLPSVIQADDPSSQLRLTQDVRGLLGLVLIFNVYALYQQHVLKQLRSHLAEQIEIAAEQKARSEALYELTILDPLTGLFNRRHCEQRLRSEMSRADRLGDSLIVLYFDLDGFKTINDRFGHASGDAVLKEFARSLSKATRGSDFAVRMGGDEFLIVLTECPPQQVKLVLSRLTPFEVEIEGERVCVSTSCGWAQYQPGDTAEELIARADDALYAHKTAQYKDSEREQVNELSDSVQRT